jgi:phthalate 4,5-cis-dihydrodiol dehydrogenase
MARARTQDITVAVIGCGEQARDNLIPSLLQIEGISVRAACDIVMSRATEAVRIFHGATAYQDYEALFSEREIQAVILAGPPQMHFEVAKRALSNGIHVFVEKPPTVSTGELLQLISLAGEGNLVTAVGHNFRYSTAYLMMKELSLAESFGRPLLMEIRYFAAQPRGIRWGLPSVFRSFLLSHAIHAIDLFQACMGPVSTLSATAVELDNGAVLLTTQFKFKSKAVGVLSTGSCGTHFQIDIRLTSDTSRILYVDSLRRLISYGSEGDPKRWGRIWEPRPLEGGYRHAGYLGELESFFHAIREGNKTTPSLSDELAVYEIMDAIETQVSDDLKVN